MVTEASTVRLRRRTLQKVHLLDAVGSGRDVNLGLQASLGLILCGNRFLERVHGSRLDQVDGAASKAAARHARAKHARLLGSDLHHEVKFLATDFVVFTQAAMRRPYQAAESTQAFGV